MVGNHQEPLTRIQRQMHRILSFTALAVEECQLPTCLVDAEGTDLTAVAMNSVEAITGAIEGKKRGIHQVVDQLHLLQRAGVLIQPIDRDAITTGIALPGCARSDISEHWGITPACRIV
ncbi:hypothetical protein D3C79_892100 [compost metagenome]